MSDDRWVIWGAGKWHRMTSRDGGTQIVTKCGAWTWKRDGYTVIDGMPTGSAADDVCRKCAKGRA